MGDLLQQDEAVRFLQVGVVVIESLVYLEATGLVELESHLVEHVHVQVHSGHVWLLGELFF